MDPDAILIILLLLGFLALFIINCISLSKKIFQPHISNPLKAAWIVCLAGFLVFSYFNFHNAGTEATVVSPFDIIIFLAALIIGINWSIHIYRKYIASKFTASPQIVVPLLSLVFGLLLLFSLKGLGYLVDSLNLMGNNG